MAKIITITNGVGTSELINDTYTVTADVVGYDNTTIDPSSVEVVEGTNTYSFTIAATGTLTLHVSEDGTSTGEAIEGATFVRTDSTGTEYGTPVVTDENGDAVFYNAPYATENAPTIYFKQTTSDGNHDFDTTIQSTTMTEETATIEIENIPGESRTIYLMDANYENLPIDNAELTFAN